MTHPPHRTRRAVRRLGSLLGVSAGTLSGILPGVLSGLWAGAGCSFGPQDADDVGDTTAAAPSGRELVVDDNPPVLSDVVPPPVMGGGLLITQGDAFAVVSDPDRDIVHVVDLEQGVEAHAIALEPGDLPWRSVEDADGRVHVIARGSGALVTIAPAEGEIIARRSVCADPRGIDVLPGGSTLVVACAGGELLTIGAQDGAVIERSVMGPDLRDVVVLAGEPWVTRFRAATIGPMGGEASGSPVTMQGGANLHPNTAWRTVGLPDDRWLMLHQISTDRAIAIDPPDDEPHPDSGGDASATGSSDDGDGGEGYGGGTEHDPCGGLVQTALTIGDRHGDTRSSGSIGRTMLAVDVAVSPGSTKAAIAAASGVVVVSLSDFALEIEASCREDVFRPEIGGDVVAVAFADDGRLYAFNREPAALWRIDLATEETRRMTLTGPSRADTGHAIFHRDAGFGISCASCHPEGGDDGRVWAFAPIGGRHTPALDVGLRGTEPFHWAGELDSIGVLLDEVHGRRMGAALQAPARREAFERFLYAIPVPAPRRSPDDASTRGREAFEALGCVTCHAGDALTTNETVEIGAAVPLQIPTLRAVASHPPYMHDGRAAGLREAVWDMVVRTRPQAELEAEELDDLVAYLETL